MTDRKPDIITKWNIRKANDTYIGKCVSLPNAEITGENPDIVCTQIRDFLGSMYIGNTQIDGGITGFTAEFGITKRQEMSLDSFEMPSDDPTPEPATDAPELHEPTGNKMKSVAPKKPKAKKTTKDTRTQLEKELFPKPCSTCFHLSATKQCVCPKSPNYRIIINNPNACTCHCCHETKEQYEKRQSKYVWHPIKELVAGCALCELFRQNKCVGNKEGTSCKRYVCRPDAGSHCATCRNRGEKLPYKQGGEERYMCNHHHQPVSLDDFNCYAVKE